MRKPMQTWCWVRHEVLAAAVSLGLVGAIAAQERRTDDKVDLAAATELMRRGEFARAEQLVARRDDAAAARLLERIRRIRLDYRYDQDQVFAQLQRRVEGLTRGELDALVTGGRLDARLIDGERRFLYAAASNALFRLPEVAARRRQLADLAPVTRAMLAAANDTAPAARRLRVTHSVTVGADAVPAGEVVRCWIPFPRAFPWQRDAELLRASPGKARLARPDAPMRSAYLEAEAEAGQPLVFRIEYELTVARRSLGTAVGPEVDVAPAAPQFLAEQPPHVRFTPELRQLGDRIVAGKREPIEIARAVADWIATECVYSYAPEYSTLECIAASTAENRFGDCGQSALLFITLCRMNGVPARWQSGWLLLPGLKTIHDWAEVHLPERGWVPADPWAVQFVGAAATPLDGAERDRLAAFYVGGIDGWRIAANADHGRDLAPAKEHSRSDDVDFQRGEVEWRGGNLYFPKWSYRLEFTVESTAETGGRSRR